MNVLEKKKEGPALPVDSILINDIDRIMERAVGYSHESDRFSSSLVCQASLKHLRSGGGRSRALLSHHIGECLGLATKDAMALGAAVELLHNASLVHDDIHDKSVTRRGRPNIRAIYGDDLAILVGDIMISGAYGVLAEDTSPKYISQILGYVHSRVRDVINGQWSDIESFKRCRTEEDYIAIAALKSGGLIRLAMELPFIATGYNRSVVDKAGRAAERYAVAYQIFDDLLDIQEDSKSEFKEQSLNFIHLLSSKMSLPRASTQAIRIVRETLSSVISECEDLPKGSGLPLIHLSQQLQSTMTSEFG
jgi:geranylgeranyl diphosphate synthase type II